MPAATLHRPVIRMKCPERMLFSGKRFPMRARVLLLGVENSVAVESSRTLQADRHSVAVAPLESPAVSARRVDDSLADIVFCGAAPSLLAALVRALRERRSKTLVVAATRVPDTAFWLDAIDAGAWDYCNAPFEPQMVRRMLENALGNPRGLAVAG